MTVVDALQPSNATARPTLALSMIVRDEARDLQACAWRVHGVEDEILIGETGSMDNTIALVQTSPAKQYYLRAASSYAQMQDSPRAAELLKISLSRFPSSEKLRVALAEVDPQPAKAWRAFSPCATTCSQRVIECRIGRRSEIKARELHADKISGGRKSVPKIECEPWEVRNYAAPGPSAPKRKRNHFQGAQTKWQSAF
jgi:hypothetical protein